MIAGIVALFILLGWNCLVGIGVMAIVLTCNLQIAKCSERVTKKELEATDSRMSTMKEVIDGIQQVKLGAWEENYLSLLSAKRAMKLASRCARACFKYATLEWAEAAQYLLVV